MEVNLDNVNVIHNEEARRFELHVNGLQSLLTYRGFPELIVFDHTDVPEALEGQGVASKLARAALDYSRANHLRIVPLCPYISSFIRKHTEYQDLLSSDDLQKLQSS